MTKALSNTEFLAKEFLRKTQELHADIEPIRVLKARAYRIGEANVFIRAASERNKRYFFGLNYIHAEELANLDNPFFAFICGSLEHVLIIPAASLINALPFISHDRNGEYKIIVDRNLNIALKGRGNRLDCSAFFNAWQMLLAPPKILNERSTAEQSLHSVVQGRLLEIGNARGFQTFSPNKSKKFNNKTLADIATLRSCPELQFSDYDLLRQIDVLWFREKGNFYVPEYAFEVELSTGTWSGVGRMATLLDYANARFYIISNEPKKYQQVMNSYIDFQARYHHLPVDAIGELYAAELNVRELRSKYSL